MADNKKIYTIQINGIEQSIKQVDALSDSLQFLDKKIKELESRTVSVTSPTSSGSGSRNAELQTEDKLLKQIQSTEEQIRNARREDYQSLLAQKDILGDIVDEAKQRAAAERLSSGNYGNTMKGLKQELSDIKKVMQTTDLGDEKFKELTDRAGVLTNKLKELEQAYGQFGRNVGNYTSAFDNIKKVTVQVGNTTREFNSVRDASRQLTQELKAMAIQGKENTEEYKELSEAVHNFEMASRRAESAVNDLKASSQGMDNILDMFESFTALGSVGQGLSAFFGVDDSEIQRSIQKLVALQNVMQGIEKIRQQMNTGEGIGAVFSKGSASVDNFVSKLTGAQVTMNGLTMSSKAATVAVRGLSLALKAIGVGLAMEGIALLMRGIENIGKEMEQSKSKAEALDEALNTVNKTYRDRRDMLSASFMSGALSNERFLTEQYKLQTEYMSEQLDMLKERISLMNESQSNGFHFMDNFATSTYKGGVMDSPVTIESYNWWSGLIPALSETVHNIQEVEEEFRKCQEAVKEGKDYFDKWGEGLNGYVNSIFASVADTERTMRELGKIDLGNFIGSFEQLNTKFKNGEISADEFARKLKELKAEMNSNDVLRSVLVNLDKYIPDEKVREAVNNIISEISRLDDAFNMTSEAQIHHWNQVRIDAMADGAEKIAAQMKENERHEIAQYGHTQEQISLIQAKYNRQRLNQTQKYNEQAKNKAKALARDIENAEKELNSLRIANMREGLNKTLKQLEEERRQRIEKARQNGHKVGEIEEEINKLYNKKILDAKEEWSYRIQQVYINMWKRIYDINHNSAQMDFETQLRDLETQYQRLQEAASNKLDKYTASYSQDFRGISRDTAGRLGRAEVYFSKADIAMGQKYIDLLNMVKLVEGKINEQRDGFDYGHYIENEGMLNKELAKRQQILQDYLDQVGMTQNEMEELYVVQALREQNYSKSLLIEYKLRINNRREYYREIERLSIEELDKQYEIENEKAKENYNNEWRTMVNAYSAQDEELKKHLKNGEITQAQYNEAVERLNQERVNAEVALSDKYHSLGQQREQEHQNKIKQIKANSYNLQITEYRDFLSRLNQVDTSTPLRDSGGWGIVNISETKKRNREVLNSYTQLASDIVNEKHKLQASLDANEISFDDFQQAQRELNSLQNNVADAMRNIEASNKQLIADFWGSIDQWIQQVGQTMNSIIGSLSEIQSNQYDKMIEEQEKYIEEYENLLDKQKDITQEHASAVESIEDELSTARGDRRQQLIDQLNAEMAAQRASLAQEQKIEKQRQKAEEKKKKLEHDQAVAKKKMQLAQAAINMAMAISMAAVNSWPIPAIPMMALAAAAGAAQIAAIQSQNIPSYGSGGVIQGKSHAQGGVKVLGGQAEVEGGEYITNKVTTAKNVDLLEYINTKRRKVNLDDLIEFYSNGKTIKKNVASVRTKFADGGMIPTLRNDINLSDRMLTAFEDYSKRPVVVSVVDIIDKTQVVNEVRAMAGLEV